MKKYSITYDWKCITEREWRVRNVNTADFKGHLAVLDIKKVSEPQIWKYNGKDLTVCDNNYQWLIMLPENDFYCITAMMNEKREIQVCYIDMIAGQGCDYFLLTNPPEKADRVRYHPAISYEQLTFDISA